MFEKLATTPSRTRSTKAVELPLTIAFLTVVQREGFRLSYGALAISARILGEDSSRQIVAQRGSTLVKSLPESLQPFVCRKSGKYGKGVLAKFASTPSDLVDRPVINSDGVAEAIAEYEEAKGS